MKHFTLRIRMLLIALAAATAMQAEKISATIGDYKYELDTETQTAAITGGPDTFFRLYDIVIPEKVTYQETEFTVTEIGNNAFGSANIFRSITSLTIPETVTRIGDGAFADCTSLMHIICHTTAPITLNATVAYWSEESVPNCIVHVRPGTASAYRNADVWKRFEHIEENVDAVKINEIDNIVYFLNSEKRTASVMKRDYYYGGHIVIPNRVACDDIEYTVTEIEHGAFYSCNDPLSITLPEGLKKIGQYALYGIKSAPIYCYTESPAEVSKNTFDLSTFIHYRGQDDIVLHVKTGTKNDYRNADIWKLFDIVDDLVVNDDKTVVIDDNIYSITREPHKTATLISLQNNSGDIILPDHIQYNGEEYEITGISNRAFENCKELTGITLPQTLTYIGHSAFKGCSLLTEITLPQKVSHVGSGAFAGCTRLTTINVSEGNEHYTSINGVLFTADQTELVSFPAYNRDTRGYAIPETVVSIREYAFSHARLSVVMMPECLMSIGDKAFYNCDFLQVIRWESDNTSISIGDEAFSNCTDMGLIELPQGVASIGCRAFYNCKNLKTIDLPEGITRIGSLTFSQSSINQVTLPESVATIEYGAFYGCSQLTEITLPKKLSLIEDYTFSGCNKLTNITLPQSITTIGNYAFYDCDELTSITLPQNITTIGDHAFYDCWKLADIYSHTNKPQGVEFIKKSWWEDPEPWDTHTYANCTLHVKPGTGDDYRNTDVWKNFTNIVEDLETGIQNAKAGDKGGITLDGNGLTLGRAAWTVSTIDGRAVAQGTNKEKLRLPTGIYVVRCGNTVKKIHIR